MGTGFQRAVPLFHPVMLFRFTAVKGCSPPGICLLDLTHWVEVVATSTQGRVARLSWPECVW